MLYHLTGLLTLSISVSLNQQANDVNVIRHDYTFAHTTGLNAKGFGTGGDCRDVTWSNGVGSFMVNLAGTGFRLADDVRCSLIAILHLWTMVTDPNPLTQTKDV